MKRIYIVTGAAGHLGGWVVRLLCDRGETVRALVLPGEKMCSDLRGAHLSIYEGDVCKPDTLGAVFQTDAETELVVIHCAG
jgi:dihydroflavonol-4-reductase